MYVPTNAQIGSFFVECCEISSIIGQLNTRHTVPDREAIKCAAIDNPRNKIISTAIVQLATVRLKAATNIRNVTISKNTIANMVNAVYTPPASISISNC